MIVIDFNRPYIYGNIDKKKSKVLLIGFFFFFERIDLVVRTVVIKTHKSKAAQRSV